MLEVLKAKYREKNVRIATKKDDNGIILYEIAVDKGMRGKGLGTAYMTELCQYADQVNCLIALTPSKGLGATSVIRLKKFYQRFGFVMNDGNNRNPDFNEAMIRNPKAIKVK